jgi:hypothetical protein
MHEIARKTYNREISSTAFIIVQRSFSSTMVERLARLTKLLTFGGSKHCLENTSVECIRIPEGICCNALNGPQTFDLLFFSIQEFLHSILCNYT